MPTETQASVILEGGGCIVQRALRNDSEEDSGRSWYGLVYTTNLRPTIALGGCSIRLES